MEIKDIINVLEQTAPLWLQESYDNAGLLTGNELQLCTGVLCTLDVTEAVLAEAIAAGCNLIVAHHPLIFKGIKSITGKNEVERTIITAIKNDVAIYAIHTNLDNIITGVNGRMADKLGLINRQPLSLKTATLKKLYSFVPTDHAEKIRAAVFAAGGGQIGNYSECSFNTPGTGTFKAGEGAHPFAGSVGSRHAENESRIEVVFPSWLQQSVVAALLATHPYEEPAYDVIDLVNSHPAIGSGLTGMLPAPQGELPFLRFLKEVFGLSAIRHTRYTGKPIQKVSLCGGSGSFLISRALSVQSDIFISADIKYHEFFEADGRMVIADIGHFESERFTTDLLYEILQNKFPTFAVLKTAVNTNPVSYFA